MKTNKYKVTAEIHKLTLNKHLDARPSVLWRRNTDQTQTPEATHSNGAAVWEKSLTLIIPLTCNSDQEQCQEKITELVVAVTHHGKQKTLGYAKYDVARLLNDHLKYERQTIPLEQCPDPKATLEVTFDYEVIHDGQQTSLANIPSKGVPLDLSDLKANDKTELGRLNKTIIKLGELANKSSQASAGKPNSVEALNEQIKKLQRDKQTREAQHKQARNVLEKKVAELTAQLSGRRESKEPKSLQSIENGDKDFQKQYMKYRKMYEQVSRDLQTMRDTSRIDNKDKILNFHTVEEISYADGSMDIGELRAQNNELAVKLATTSYKLAMLFNASYEYGGAKLLDYLQNAIGLTES